jgi:tripartite-type tricarboxylate transporter receptor subunit TctC
MNSPGGLMRHDWFALLLGLFSFTSCNQAIAEYPDKPIRIIVPFAAGGPSDAAARILGKALAVPFGQQVVTDNRPGANGEVAAQTLLNSQPSGYTLMWGVGSMAGIPFSKKNAAFESLNSFAPVSLVGQFTFGMFIHPGLSLKTVAEFIQHARGAKEPLAYAHSTMSEYLTAAQVMQATKISMTRVPYKGSAIAVPDLIAGRVHMYITPISMALPFARDGRLRLLATVSEKRSPATPDVPTMRESGLPDIAAPAWQAIFAPPQTPSRITAFLTHSVRQALLDAEVKTQLGRLVMDIDGSSAERLTQVIGQDIAAWKVFVRDNNVAQE